MKKRDWIFVAIIVCFAIGAFIYFDRVQIMDWAREQNREPLPEAIEYHETKAATPEVTTPKKTTPVVKTTVPKTEKPSAVPLAPELNLAVPFTSQAPTGDWSEPFQDSCEEASVLMVHEFYAGNTSKVIDLTVANQGLLDLVAHENKLFGNYIDTTVLETAQFAESMYGYTKSDVIENPTIEQIKERLNLGEPVLVPAAGKLLNNPYFTYPGPEYHMLVVRGYTKTNQFIVNDPGTKHGQAYLYPFDTLMNAMHDWNKNGDITNGRKAVLVLHPNSTSNP